MSPLKTRAHALRWFLLWAIPLLLGNVPCFGAKEPEHAELKVSGYGLLGNRKLKRSLELLGQPKKKPVFYNANFIEDSALVLISSLHRDGYLKPQIQAKVVLADGTKVSYDWDRAVRDEPLPRPCNARRVEYRIRKGIRYYFGDIRTEGSELLSEKMVRSYFIEAGSLLRLKRSRIYSPNRLDRGLANIAEVLNRRGYESALVTTGQLAQDDVTGQVDLVISMKPGPRSRVRTIREEFYVHDQPEPERVLILETNRPFSKLWLQDFIQQLRATNYHLGYPDTTVHVTQARREAEGESINVDLLAQVRSGPLVRLGQVKFVGQSRTKPSMLERRVHLNEGAPLDRIAVEEGRYRLARLGIFDTVGLQLEPVDEQTRNAVYELKEGRTIDFSILFGLGSYELLRGGIEVEQNNLFGRAHHARLRLVQSFKASYGEYIYTMPELIGRDIDVFFNGSALRREEIDFTREEFGGGVGVRKYLPEIESDLRVRYNYEVLNAAEIEVAAEEGLTSANVGAVITELRHDRQDNPLYPRKGYKLFGTFEIASEYLAGDVDYQRLELHAAYHQPLDAGRWIHFGLAHGAILTLGSSAEDLPFNRRFFPGGDNSVRGYQQGEAAPRNARGKIVGAETYLFGSVEFEQALTPTWAVVGFLDTVSFAQRLSDYPFNESLFSVGTGVRWKTIIGPVRLEYGYNLNRRSDDPVGTVQFSVGFPF